MINCSKRKNNQSKWAVGNDYYQPPEGQKQICLEILRSIFKYNFPNARTGLLSYPSSGLRAIYKCYSRAWKTCWFMFLVNNLLGSVMYLSFSPRHFWVFFLYKKAIYNQSGREKCPRRPEHSYLPFVHGGCVGYWF